MKKLQFLGVAALLAAVSTTANAQLFTQNFDGGAGAIANFTVTGTNAADNAANENFNYGTYVNTAGTAVPIPSAPNSTGATTIGLQVYCNIAAGVVNAINIYPNLGAALPDEYKLQFDMYANFAEDNTATTTEFATWGAAADATGTLSPGNGTLETGSNGFYFAVTTEGGSGTDARYGEGTGALADANTKPGWPVSTSDPIWLGWFPESTNTANQGSNAGFFFYRWTTVEMIVNQATSTVTIYFTPAGGTRSLAASGVSYLGSATRPYFGLSEVFGGSLGGADTFLVFDNIVITDETPAVPASAAHWNVYN